MPCKDIRRIRQQTGGGTLSAVLLVLSFAAIMTFAIAGRFIARQRFTRNLELAGQAEALARSGLATCIAEIRRNREFGTTATTRQHQLNMPGVGVATTDVVNNLAGSARLEGCPTGCAMLTSTGEHRGVKSTLRCTIAAPPFPYAIASTGPIRSTGGLTMGAIPPGFDPRNGLDVSRLQKAEMITQSEDDGSPALLLQGQCTLVGKAKSAGTAQVPPQETCEVLEDVQEDSVPRIPLAELAQEGTILTLTQPTYNALEKLAGQYQFSGPRLHFRQGLQLNGATLRIQGDLVIDGPVSGIGALVVDGDVTLNGGAELSADNQCAILASGDVAVVGRGRDTSFFQGLIYAAGDGGLRLQDCTVVGTVLNAGDNAPMQVDRAAVAFNPAVLNFAVDLSATGASDQDSLTGARLKQPLPLSSFYRDGAWDIPSNVRPNSTPEDPYPLSPLEQHLLPHLEFRFDGAWYADRQAALDAGMSSLTVQTAIGLAADTYLRRLHEVSHLTPSSSALNFRLDFNRYLQTSGRLHIVRLETL